MSTSLAAAWAEIASAVGPDGWLLIGGPYKPVKGRDLPYSASILTPPDPPTFETGEERPRDRWAGHGDTPLRALREAERDWRAGGIHDGRHGTRSCCSVAWEAIAAMTKEQP